MNGMILYIVLLVLISRTSELLKQKLCVQVDELQSWIYFLKPWKQVIDIRKNLFLFAIKITKNNAHMFMTYRTKPKHENVDKCNKMGSRNDEKRVLERSDRERHIPPPKLVWFWYFLRFWMAIQDVVFTFYRWASPYIACCKTLFLAVIQVSNLMW